MGRGAARRMRAGSLYSLDIHQSDKIRLTGQRVVSGCRPIKYSNVRCETSMLSLIMLPLGPGVLD